MLHARPLSDGLVELQPRLPSRTARDYASAHPTMLAGNGLHSLPAHRCRIACRFAKLFHNGRGTKYLPRHPAPDTRSSMAASNVVGLNGWHRQRVARGSSEPAKPEMANSGAAGACTSNTNSRPRIPANSVEAAAMGHRNPKSIPFEPGMNCAANMRIVIHNQYLAHNRLPRPASSAAPGLDPAIPFQRRIIIPHFRRK